MKKFIERLRMLMSKRSFWINASGAAVLIINQILPFLPPQYIAGATMAANLINRFIKVINEEPK